MPLKAKQSAERVLGVAGGKEVRCDCGCLLAKRVGDTLELKCRRCKRVVGVAKIISNDGSCDCDTG